MFFYRKLYNSPDPVEKKEKILNLSLKDLSKITCGESLIKYTLAARFKTFFCLDKEGIIICVNDRLKSLCGCEPKKVVGLSLDFMHADTNDIFWLKNFYQKLNTNKYAKTIATRYYISKNEYKIVVEGYKVNINKKNNPKNIGFIVECYHF